jgi:arylsulfatase A-like enzyme
MKRLRSPAVLLSATLALIVQAAPATKPNIIFILGDDLGYGDVGCYGQKNIKTPNIDRLAAEGIRFTQGYAGSTVCAPSRCVLMTGLHTGHCRVRGNGGATPVSQALRTGDVTAASILQKAGYTTALTGKWGLGDVGPAEVGLPRRQGFDYFYGYANQTHAHNYYPTFLWRNEEKVALRNVVPNERTNGAGVATTRLDYSAALIADEALAFIRRAKNQPFFLYYATTLPHANNEAKNKGMEVPDYGEYADRDWPEPVKGHAAMVSRLDRDAGRMLDLLKELGLDNKTIVFFTSDNGTHQEGGYDPEVNHSSGPLRGIKRAIYEGGIRVPFIARWPGVIKPGVVSEEVVWFADFLPTAAALAGTKPPANLDGVNLLPHLRNPARRVNRSAPLYWEFHEGGFKQALREGEWKLVNNGAGKTLELYNLRQDLGEANNVAAQNPKLVKRLETRLAKAHVDTPDWPITPPRRGRR